ncbi:Putative salt-induced outer membrane protein YdiY [Microbulbifer donghaiensis]|uniref:Putative salt-induced outer membrane protein YdiY n=1 Tax=Microbulbifer donghaiensis TaxID=494016 RepID=A0A1M5I6J4_9GAMM|nr:Putative salt-induced outer membrane protein YdiY [Microbulbifer donghaiensis]
MTSAIRRFASILLFFVAIVSLQASAGVLTLSNGDRVNGDLVVVEREHVVWKSENFGEIKIEKSKIVSMDVDVDLKIAGREGPCALAGHRREQWELYCDEGAGWVMDFPAIDRAEPYVNYVGDPVVFHGNVSAGGVFEHGNREREDLDVNVNLDVRNGDFHHLINALYQSQSNQEVEGLEKYLLGYNLRWIFSEKWFAAANSELQREEARNLDLGTKFGLGLGYLFFDTEKTAFSLEGGVSSLQEDFIDSALSEDQDERYAAGRVALNYRYKFSLGPEIYLDQETLQSFDRSEDYQANAKFGVRTPLVEGVLMEIAYHWLYDNTPSLDLEKEDTKVTVGVGYQW